MFLSDQLLFQSDKAVFHSKGIFQKFQKCLEQNNKNES